APEPCRPVAQRGAGARQHRRLGGPARLAGRPGRRRTGARGGGLGHRAHPGALTPRRSSMSAANQVRRVAGWSLVGALVLAVVGRALEKYVPAPFWGGLLIAFGEAALVGGLADWFAVRALFAHPFGIPFPHTALIPRNRGRIVREICQLVQHEWL